jgi:hypothetical protein
VSDSNVIKLAQPGAFTDSLTEILRSGERASEMVSVDVLDRLVSKQYVGKQRIIFRWL